MAAETMVLTCEFRWTTLGRMLWPVLRVALLVAVRFRHVDGERAMELAERFIVSTCRINIGGRGWERLRCQSDH
jgi:hypothetical protein